MPPCVRTTKTLETALPWMYLKGVSTGDMDAALEVLVDPDSRRVVGKCGIAAKAQLGAGLPGVANSASASGHGSLGVCLGR